MGFSDCVVSQTEKEKLVFWLYLSFVIKREFKFKGGD